MTATAPPPVLPDDLATLARDECARWQVPGLTVGVLHDGAVTEWVHGTANLATGAPVTPDTIFQVGSITKLFTATLVMGLVDSGAVELDTPVRRYLPDFRMADESAAAALTLRHVLSHAGGFDGDRFTDYGPGDDAVDRAVAAFPELRQYTAPGELWAYCNTGFQVAGAVIGRATGGTYEKAVRTRIVKPLGMGLTFLFPHEAITNRVAAGHNALPSEEAKIARRYVMARAMAPAGAILSTVGDLLRFAAMHMSDGETGGARVLSPEAARAMRQSAISAIGMADGWGIGFGLSTVDGVQIISHGGSTNGFRARLVIVPEQRFALAMLSNGNGGRAAEHAVELAALERYLGLRGQTPATVPLPAAELQRYAGRYTRPIARLAITATDTGLLVQQTDTPANGPVVAWPAWPAVPVGGHRFMLSDGEFTGEVFDFIPGADPAGPPRFVRFHGRLSDREA